MDGKQLQAEEIRQRVSEQFKDWRECPMGSIFFKRVKEMITDEEKKRVTKIESPGETGMATARKEGYIQALEDVSAMKL